MFAFKHISIIDPKIIIIYKNRVIPSGPHTEIICLALTANIRLRRKWLAVVPVASVSKQVVV